MEAQEAERTIIYAPRTASEANDMLADIAQRRQACELYAEACDTKAAYYAAQKKAERDKLDTYINERLPLLREFIKNMPVKKAKASESLKLPDGTIRVKYAVQKMSPDEDKLKEELKGTEYVVNEPTLKWSKLKDVLDIVDGKAVNRNTGEVIVGVNVINEPEKITVE